MRITFAKMHATGNDFVLIDERSQQINQKTEYGSLAQKLCDRHFGIGGDGLIIIQNSKFCDLKFNIFNADGSEAEMCGNGIRCFAKYVYDNKITDQQTFNVETLAGEIVSEVFLDELGKVKKVRVDMGEPVFNSPNITFESSKKVDVSEKLSTKSGDITITAVFIGNPHAVIFTDKIDDNLVNTIGPLVENHIRFSKKTNVEFVEVISDDELRMRVWERGVGETLACGTGACAAIAAAVSNNKTGDKAYVHLPGGTLLVKWKEDNHIYKSGPATLVFEGTIVVEL
mmetsp:Transcript_27625/g.12862  ORF Transcript_27625/g.12862 Transcript_27625/m.12862 type:complete len:285 (-) Transcript_27625:855-1709(-)